MTKLAEWNYDQKYLRQKNMQNQGQLVGPDLVICKKTGDERRTCQNEQKIIPGGR